MIFNTSKARATNNHSSERGSVLWFILLVIVLIGLLTAMLSRSGSTVDQSGDIEQIRIKVSKMLRYTKGVETAISRMTLNGISASDINLSPTNANTVNCTRTACKVYHIEGGGISYQAAPAGISATAGQAWLVTGANNALGVGTTEPDLILMLRNVNASYCAQINKLTNSTQGATDATISFIVFAGTYTPTQTLDSVNGQPAGCLLYGTENIFYQVLIAR